MDGMARGQGRLVALGTFLVTFGANTFIRGLEDCPLGIVGAGKFQFPSEFINVGKLVYFSASPSSSDGEYMPPELWVTDGTTEGTRRFKDVVPGFAWSWPYSLKVVHDRLFLLVINHPDLIVDANAWELWVTDGTPGATVFLQAGIPALNCDASPRPLEVAGERAFFATVTQNGAGLWVTDGTSENTVLLKSDCFPLESRAIGNRIFFRKYDSGFTGQEIWVTNGTAASTALVKHFPDGQNGSFVSLCGSSDERLVFTTNDPAQSDTMELWVSDGTPEGTMKVLPSFSTLSVPTNFARLGARLIFALEDLDHGRGIWITDLTPEGTRFLKNVYPANGFSAVGDRLLFTPDDEVRASDLWITDGTADGTMLVKEFLQDPRWPHPALYTNASFGDRLFFSAPGPDIGSELWITDGSPGGTVLFKDVLKGPESSNPEGLTVIDRKLFFSALQSQAEMPVLMILPLNCHIPFHRGDPNSSGTTDISDAILIFGFLFLGDPEALSCKESADANNDGAVDISDGIFLLNWLFTDGPEPGAPGPTGKPCGFDPDPAGSAGDLGCDAYVPCK
jgi:ELWxxDGT repeat protein